MVTSSQQLASNNRLRSPKPFLSLLNLDLSKALQLVVMSSISDGSSFEERQAAKATLGANMVRSKLPRTAGSDKNGRHVAPRYR